MITITYTTWKERRTSEGVNTVYKPVHVIKILVTGLAICSPPKISKTGRDLKINLRGDYLTNNVIMGYWLSYPSYSLVSGQFQECTVNESYFDYFFTYKLPCKRSSYNLNSLKCWQEFHRQGDSNTIDQHKLQVPVTARYLRFNPTQRHAWNCLRVEIYGTERELLPLINLLNFLRPCHLNFLLCVVIIFSETSLKHPIEEKQKHNYQR